MELDSPSAGTISSAKPARGPLPSQRWRRLAYGLDRALPSRFATTGMSLQLVDRRDQLWRVLRLESELNFSNRPTLTDLPPFHAEMGELVDFGIVEDAAADPWSWVLRIHRTAAAGNGIEG